MNGCKYLAGRIRQRSSISISTLFPDCIVGSSVRRSSFVATTLTNGQSNAKRRRWSLTQSSYIPYNNINRYNNIKHILQYFSTSTTDDNTEVADDRNEELKLISINDHLDELQHIPLDDVRNFCIIAHVVRSRSSFFGLFVV